MVSYKDGDFDPFDEKYRKMALKKLEAALKVCEDIQSGTHCDDCWEYLGDTSIAAAVTIGLFIDQVKEAKLSTDKGDD